MPAQKRVTDTLSPQRMGTMMTPLMATVFCRPRNTICFLVKFTERSLGETKTGSWVAAEVLTLSLMDTASFFHQLALNAQ